MIKDIFKYSFSIFFKDRFPILLFVLILAISVLHLYGLPQIIDSIESLNYNNMESTLESIALADGIDINTLEDEETFGVLIWKTMIQQKEFWMKYGIWMILLLLSLFLSIVKWFTNIAHKQMDLAKPHIFFIIVSIGLLFFTVEDHIFSPDFLNIYNNIYPIPIYLLFILGIEYSKGTVKPFRLGEIYPGRKLFWGIGRLIVHFLFSIVLAVYFAIIPFIVYSVKLVVIPHIVAQSDSYYLIIIGQLLLVFVCIFSAIKFVGVSFYSFLKIVYKTTPMVAKEVMNEKELTVLVGDE